ncbi:hypothetical protein cand_018390 [Cryptosporidium andersoni]|uniref:Uncharacterized protein n=1 Tax=Cryptosporidium andersoni TaxID=117008 RepID=A0A1J4M9U9_9CRYT|nr:hypothetical protein cand_018390 [Cryptosporidium andersoni]
MVYENTETKGITGENSIGLKMSLNFRGVSPEDCYYSADEDIQYENDDINGPLKCVQRFSSPLKNITETSSNRSSSIGKDSIPTDLTPCLFEEIYSMESNNPDKKTDFGILQEIQENCQNSQLGMEENIMTYNDNANYYRNQKIKQSTRLGYKNIVTSNQLSSCTPTPLHIACKNGNVSLVREILLLNDTDVNYSGPMGYSSLHWAALRGHLLVVKELLKFKANPNVKTHMCCTPLHFAAAYGYEDVVIALLNAGANTESVSINGNTPLLSASYRGHEGVVRTLLKNNANRVCKNNQGLMAIDAAKLHGHFDVVQILESWGCIKGNTDLISDNNR